MGTQDDVETVQNNELVDTYFGSTLHIDDAIKEKGRPQTVSYSFEGKNCFKDQSCTAYIGTSVAVNGK